MMHPAPRCLRIRPYRPIGVNSGFSSIPPRKILCCLPVSSENLKTCPKHARRELTRKTGSYSGRIEERKMCGRANPPNGGPHARIGIKTKDLRAGARGEYSARHERIQYARQQEDQHKRKDRAHDERCGPFARVGTEFSATDWSGSVDDCGHDDEDHGDRGQNCE